MNKSNIIVQKMEESALFNSITKDKTAPSFQAFQIFQNRRVSTDLNMLKAALIISTWFESRMIL